LSPIATEDFHAAFVHSGITSLLSTAIPLTPAADAAQGLQGRK